jgi:hypothetical protein
MGNMQQQIRLMGNMHWADSPDGQYALGRLA